MRPLLLTSALLLVTTGAFAQQAPDADQLALRQLKSDLTTAVTQRDFGATEKLLNQPFSATLITQANFQDVDGLRRYYDTVFTQGTPRLKDMSMNAEVDGPSLILTGTFAINKGVTNDHYVLTDGRSFDMKGRWTSVSLKQPDGSWKLLAVHTGVNFLDNPVISAIERSVAWTAGIGLAAGLAFGVFGSWGFRRLAARRQAR